MKAYKVTILRDSKWSSTCTNKFSLTYDVGTKSVPIVGKIFVFKKIADAEFFLKTIYLSCKSYCVFEGEAENCRPISWVSFSNVTIEEFWKAKKNHKRPNMVVMMPPNKSYSCTSFKPTKIIWKVD